MDQILDESKRGLKPGYISGQSKENKSSPGEDPFEEFEFRPLSGGLGFYKNPASGSASSSTNAKKREIDSLEIRSPLPRTEEAGDEIIGRIPMQTPQLRIENPPAKKVGGVEATKKIGKESLLVATIWEPTAVFLDAMLVAATFLSCLIVLILVTKVDLFAQLMRPDAETSLFATLILLLAFVSWAYLSVSRMFAGRTAGEWVVDQQVGTSEQQTEWSYSIRVLGRSLIVIATGWMLVPIFSFALNRDLAGLWTGAPLLRKKN